MAQLELDNNKTNQKTQKLNITYIRQNHFQDGDSAEEMLKVALSQHAIAVYLSAFGKHNSTAIFVEKFTTTQTLTDTQRNQSDSIKVFPGGTIPADHNNLSMTQKLHLTKHGAPRTLLELGILKKLYPGESEKLLKEAWKKFGPVVKKHGIEFANCMVGHNKELHEVIATKREQAVIDKILQLPNTINKAIIIFGGGHDFAPEAREAGLEISQLNFSGLSHPPKSETLLGWSQASKKCKD